MISFYMLSERFRLICLQLSDIRAVSITKKEYGFAVYIFIKIHEVFIVNIKWIIKCYLSKLLFVWNFHNNVVCRI